MPRSLLLLSLATSLAAAPPVLHRVTGKDDIPAIDAPRFVTAAASGLSPDERVLGFAHRGEAHAYSLDLLNRHEVVNDVVGGLPVAATW